MTTLTRAAIAIVIGTSGGACGNGHLAAADRAGDRIDPQEPPMARIPPIAKEALCVTKGAARLGERVTQPTLRAIARGTSGDAASLTFTYRGETEHARALASGQDRRQLGLKLRAANGCNLVYVMWRLDPRPALDVSVKYNPGMTTHKACGASGYEKVKPVEHLAVPPLVLGEPHTLRAELDGDELTTWIDDHPHGAAPSPPTHASCPAPPACAPTTSRSTSSRSARPRAPPRATPAPSVRAAKKIVTDYSDSRNLTTRS